MSSRRAGAWAAIPSATARSAISDNRTPATIGRVTTHDLALTSVANELSPRAANVHFADWFEKDDIRFDYRMKPGPVTRSNALALMRAVGLDVPIET